LDHIIPKFKSGCSSRHNLIPACRRCNSNKGSDEMQNWYEKQDFFSLENLNLIRNWVKSNTLEFMDTSSQPDNAVA
jgi:5-methylcytosine-specific restriction endonuclease McrA